jgi:drug/metabolite transporter (DMT)-like permease
MPIADALAIVFVEPFILLILGSLIFGDQVGPRRIAACAVGFCGALLVIQPSLAAFGLVALWPLATAFLFAFYMLVTRAMSAWMHPVAMQFHTSWTGLLMCLPVMILANGSGIPSLDPIWPEGWNWLWLFGVGFWAAVSHMCMTYALKYAPSATLAPLHYSEIVTAVILGYLIFGDFPNAMTWAGILVIVSSGLYIIHRERIAARLKRQVAVP